MERPEPDSTSRGGEYWLSGADGVLRISRCVSCGFYQHPPLPTCPRCHGREVAFEPVSGEGSVWSYTINRYEWTPTMVPPYVLAYVELVEQEGLKIMTNIVDCDIDQVEVGMAVHVLFEQSGDTWIPVFKP